MSIVIGNDKKDFEGKEYSEVLADLKNKGFSNIHLKRNNKLGRFSMKKEGLVDFVRINGNDNFIATDTYDYTAQVDIIVNTFKDSGCDEITEIED